MRTTSAKRGAGLAERAADDLEAEPRLLVRALRRVAAVGGIGAVPETCTLAPGDDRARVADHRLVRRVARDEAALHAR